MKHDFALEVTAHIETKTENKEYRKEIFNGKIVFDTSSNQWIWQWQVSKTVTFTTSKTKCRNNDWYKICSWSIEEETWDY